MTEKLKALTIVGIGIVCIELIAVLGLHTVPKLVDKVIKA